MRCPRDGQALEQVALDHATSFVCGTCAGCAVNVTLLRRMMPTDRFRELWAVVRVGAPGDAVCPSCEHTMHVVQFSDGHGALQLDGCPLCQVMWFDAGELGGVAPDAASPMPVLDAPVPPDASDTWIWTKFFRTLNEKHFGGIAGTRGIEHIWLEKALEANEEDRR